MQYVRCGDVTQKRIGGGYRRLFGSAGIHRSSMSLSRSKVPKTPHDTMKPLAKPSERAEEVFPASCHPAAPQVAGSGLSEDLEKVRPGSATFFFVRT